MRKKNALTGALILTAGEAGWFRFQPEKYSYFMTFSTTL
jgi:hypothetical protein